MERGHILIVDDDINLCELLSLYLSKDGYVTSSVHNGAEALQVLDDTEHDLVLLDLMLPSKDGLEVCREIRQTSSIPIIMLTAKGDDIDRILGLEMGADDYIPKPFNPREVTARVKAVLRRSGATDKATTPKVMRFPGLEIHRLSHVVLLNGEEVSLTPTEFELLCYLATHEEHTLSRPQLLENVWGFDYFGEDRTVDVHIKRLRHKIEPKDHPFRYIQTVWGVGYKFKVVSV